MATKMKNLVISFNVYLQPRFYFVVILLLFANHSNTYSSYKDSVKYEVGQPMPAFNLTDVYGKPGEVINNTTIKGKYVILDFWDITCVACINSFQKLNTLQASFKDRLDIVLVGNKASERNKNISTVYEKYKKRWNLNLTSAFDEYIFKDLSIIFVPRLIWIDQDGIIKAITSSEDLTEENIKNFVGSNLKPKDVRKKLVYTMTSKERAKIISNVNYTFKLEDTLFSKGPDNSLFMSAISKWQEGMLSSTSNFSNRDLVKNNGRYRFLVAGQTAQRLYLQAAMGSDRYDIQNQYNLILNKNTSIPFYLRPLFEYKDTIRYNQIFSDQKKYNYLIIRPADLVNDKIMRNYMLKDLEGYFGYTAVVETKEMPCFVLKANRDTEAKLKTKTEEYKEVTNPALISYRKGKLSQVLQWLVFQLDEKNMEIFNDTGLSLDMLVDIDLNILYKDSIDHINKELGKYGLYLQESTKPHRVVVIREI